jgi:hypothetical protein
VARRTPACIRIDIIADVAASAQVQLDIDFLDDGVSDWTQVIPESHWKPQSFLVTMPDWYEDARFILRKQGPGRAVIAQLKVEESQDCTAEPLVFHGRPAGAACTRHEQCALGRCARIAEAGRFACSGCARSLDCSDGLRCVPRFGPYGAYRECGAPQALGGICFVDDGCAAESCGLATFPEGSILPALVGNQIQTCDACTSDSECGEGLTCGIELPDGALPHRACVEPASRRLGALCASDGECASGICCDGICQECCAGGSCADCRQNPRFMAQLVAQIDHPGFVVRPDQCSPAAGARPPGEPCMHDSDCESTRCTGVTLRCLASAELVDVRLWQSLSDFDCIELLAVGGTCD